MSYSLYRIKIHGIVQGVGFRPAMDRLAHIHGICGTVINKGSFVEILAEADEESVQSFIEDIRNHSPERSVIVRLRFEKIGESQDRRFETFEIAESEKVEGEIYISPDIAICEDCRRELFDKNDKRYLHPFINCTQCGPRFTIIEGLPYDRERTTMKDFPMCKSCHDEYFDSATRRYDAQPVCCPDCGPKVYLFEKKDSEWEKSLFGHDAISAVRRAVSEGKIAAIKGIGGYHLCCDATNDEAVKRLRDLKKRYRKPFAVMMRDMETVRLECDFDECEEKILSGHIKPILLLKKKNGKLSQYVAPDNPSLGVMLPYTPVHLLLFDYDDGVRMPDILVMTSANDSGAPIVKDEESACRELMELSDVILSNNREILTRADDSVLEMVDGREYMIRRSRGYAPVPIPLTLTNPDKVVLGIGADLKNTITVGRGDLFYPSAHIGDLEDVRSGQALEEAVDRMLTLLEVKPDAIACDMHPRYKSVEIAMKMAEKLEIPFFNIQHHYAHVASCMAENDCRGPVIGVSFDGTGYGADGTIWGGEIMYATFSDCERIGSIAPFAQIGGDSSAREGWRIAASLLMNLDEEISLMGAGTRVPLLIKDDNEENLLMSGDYMDGSLMAEELGLCEEKEYRALKKAGESGLNTIISTSAGRIFDAVSAVLGIRHESEFEGDAATALMHQAEKFRDRMTEDSYAADNYEAMLSEWRAFIVTVLSFRNEQKDQGIKLKSLSLPERMAEHLPQEADDPEEREIIHTDILFEFITVESLKAHQSDPAKEMLAYFFHDVLSDMVKRAVVAAPRKFAEKIGLEMIAEESSMNPASEEGIENPASKNGSINPEQVMEKINNILGIRTVALTGGVYQNRLLMKLTKERLEKAGYQVLIHSLIPPNDGGISLGQAAVCAALMGEM